MKKKDFELKNMISLVSGIIISVLALLTPNYFLNSFRPQLADSLISTNGQITGIVLFVATLILVVIAGFTIYFINKNQDKVVNKMIGIIVIVILSAVPALLIIGKDSSFGTIGIVYFIAMITAVLSWAGVVLTKDSWLRLKHQK